MSLHGKRDVIRSLDYLLYCYFTYTFLLDASLLILVFRVFCQLQLLSPRILTQSLRTALAIATMSLFVCLLHHCTSELGQPGILVDFIGNQHRPSYSRVILLDFVIYVFQTIRIFISSSLSSQLLLNGTAITTVRMPPALATALGAESVTLMLPPSSSSSSSQGEDDESTDDPFYQHELVVDIGLRQTYRNIMYAEIEDIGTARDGSEQLPV
ncbi:uncharacterized protein BYT42DRAFT_582582 [Radiomyces spectabilis]|uniref:uncharacterized protein n=1 Tax=Radiomyces spectabilis TaxID=64574 RepID=UPI00222101F1|nr:uncharacterized protein BYT42DRAFT_582582 [Radiomyces spectabilis]KAI8370480.1 hypothetical protein BYT42DRAFT_582582 [Radiomyces spectabilis]